MNLTGSTIQDCTYTNINSPGSGGTVKVTGNSCLTLSVSGCSFLNNQTHSSGSGLYWNAAKIIDGKIPEATVYDCTFDGNSALNYGGGIYIADGSESKPTTFTLEGSSIAIYGNEADFGADDVFANANNTKLTVPSVNDMTLTGYNLPVVGWFEDYPLNDPEYNTRLGGSLTARSSNVRYRGSEVSQRHEVLFDKDKAVSAQLANQEDYYVCMTLGIAGALPDAVVIDFALPVNINILKNETIDTSLVNGVYVSALNPNLPAFEENTTHVIGTEATGKYGTINVNSSDKTLTYTPKNISLDGVDQFSYAVRYQTTSKDENNNDVTKTYFFYSHVTVIPATNVYYEDSFLTVKNSTATSGDFGKWSIVNDQDQVIEEDKKRPAAPNQQQDRPGVDAALVSIDANNVYGYDDAYKNFTKYSLGSAKKVSVDATTGAATAAPTASFSFTGTGFDVVALTNSDSGAIWVQVAKGNSVVKSYLVNTYYGYTCNLYNVTYTLKNGNWRLTESTLAPNGAVEQKAEKPADAKNGDTPTGVEYIWVVDPDATDSLYQVPVIKVTGLEYDTYRVIIKAAYLASMDMDLKDSDFKEAGGKKVSTGSYTIWLDAIRIYDPIDTNGTTQDSTTAKDAYEQDGESNPVFITVKDELIKKDTFDQSGNGNGIIYVDGKSANVTIADYKDQGPNNETYLKPNNGIAFTLKATTVKPLAVHVGAKLAKGTTADLYLGTTKLKTITTSTNMFYNLEGLTWSGGAGNWSTTVVLSCKSTDTNAILSLTDLKLTSKQVMVAASDLDEDAQSDNNQYLVYLVVDEETAETGIRVVNRLLSVGNDDSVNQGGDNTTGGDHTTEGDNTTEGGKTEEETTQPTTKPEDETTQPTTKPTTGSNKPVQDSSNAKTGDNMMLYVMLMLFSLMGIGAASVLRNKEEI